MYNKIYTVKGKQGGHFLTLLTKSKMYVHEDLHKGNFGIHVFFNTFEFWETSDVYSRSIMNLKYKRDFFP
jgi:hypothetical protein